jgi:acetolactate synthase regulatory subunit
MQRTIYAKTEGGLDGFLKVITTLRRKTFDIQDVGMSYNADVASLTIVLNEHPDRSGDLAVGYMKQLYDVYDVVLV